MAQPTKHPVTGIYQLRRKVPADLVSVLGREFKRSLGTRDPAEAKRRHAAQWLVADELFAKARGQVATGARLPERDMQQLASRWYHEQVLAMDESNDYAHWLVPATGLIHESRDVREIPVFTTLRAEDEDEDDPSLAKVVAGHVTATLRTHGVVPPIRGSTEEVRLRQVFKEHLLRLSDLAYERHQGNWLFQPEAMPMQPLAAERRSSSNKANDGGLIALFERYAKDKLLNDGDTPRTRKTLASYRAMCNQFVEITKVVTLSEVTRDAVGRFREVLAQLPARGEGVRNMSVPDLLAKVQAEALPLVTAATVRNKLRAVSAVLSFGVRMGLLIENPILASGLARAAAKTAKVRSTRRTKSYSAEEIRRIFASPVFAPGVKSGRADFGEAWRWMPLLMYYTGARREELAQLMVRDIKNVPGTPPYISILASLDETDDGRRVKNESSRRQVPLHPDLIARGFLAYAETLEDGGQLFPKLKPNPAGFRGENFGKHWGRYLRDEVGLTSSAHPSHGFRHTFKTLCRQVGIPEDVSDAITGHVGTKSEGRRYGEWPLARLAEELRKYPTAALASEA